MSWHGHAAVGLAKLCDHVLGASLEYSQIQLFGPWPDLLLRAMVRKHKRVSEEAVPRLSCIKFQGIEVESSAHHLSLFLPKART